jgi:hypothetical protein
MWTAPAIAAIIGVLMGLLMLLIGLGTVISPRSRVRALREFGASGGMQLVGGMLSFVVGAAVVIMVPLSNDMFAICVTVLGWAMLLKGALLLLWGDGMMEMAGGIGERAMPTFGWLLALAGAALFISALGELGDATKATMVEQAAPVVTETPETPETPKL